MIALLVTSLPLGAYATTENEALPGGSINYVDPGSEPQGTAAFPDATDSTDPPDEPDVPDKGSEEPYILSEINELREESAKHFLLSDGSCMAVMYGVPVHERDAEGQWSDIDNSLVLSYNKLMTKDGRVSFSKNVNEDGEIYTLSEGDTGITVALIERQGTVLCLDKIRAKF